jgi:hypothetical protein
MDTFKDFKFDINRFILQLLIPGIIASFPYFIIIINNTESIQNFFISNIFMLNAVLIIVSLTVGLFLENVGSLYEAYCLDKINNKKYPNHEVEWDQYLKLDKDKVDKIIAQGYIKKIYNRLKFELSFSFALIFMIVGLVILQCNIHFVKSCINFTVGCIIIPLAISIYTFIEAKNSTVLLIENRKRVLVVVGKNIN